MTKISFHLVYVTTIILLFAACTHFGKEMNSYEGSPEAAIRNYGPSKGTLINYFENQNIVVFTYIQNNNKRVNIGSFTIQDDTYQYNQINEVSITVDSMTDNFQNDQYVHPQTNQQYIWGMVNDETISTVKIEYIKEDVNGNKRFTTTTDVMNNVFLTEFTNADTFSGDYKRRFVFMNSFGEVVKEEELA